MAGPADKTAAAGVPPHVRPLRIVLYVLTVAAAAAALFLEPALQGAVKRGALSRNWLFTPLAVFCVFFVVYAADRAMLVRKGRYPAGRAFFQIVFGIVFGLLLLPSSIGAWRQRRPAGVERLLTSERPDVRLVTVEALGYRGLSPERARWLAARLHDEDAEVRRRAGEVLARWSGRPATDLEALEAWAAGLTETSTRAP